MLTSKLSPVSLNREYGTPHPKVKTDQENSANLINSQLHTLNENNVNLKVPKWKLG